MASATPSNREVLQGLIEDGAIALEASAFLDHQPAAPDPSQLQDQLEGLIYGLCVGSALGFPTEGMLPQERRARFGEIRDYLPLDAAPLGALGVDAQLSLRTARRLLTDGHLDPDALTTDLAAPGHVALGDTLERFVERRCSGMSWEHSGAPSAGNGAVMRIAPVVLPHIAQPTPNLWADAAIAGMITHNDGASNSSCVAILRLIWDCITGSIPSSPDEWVDRFVEVASLLEPSDDEYTCQAHALKKYSGTLSRLVDLEVPRALDADLSVAEACERWGSGAYLLETVPSVLYILARHGHDFEEAVLRAVNDTWDNDTIACIVGAVLGATHGASSVPERWVEGLETGSEAGELLSEMLGQLPSLAQRAIGKAGPSA